MSISPNSHELDSRATDEQHSTSTAQSRNAQAKTSRLTATEAPAETRAGARSVALKLAELLDLKSSNDGELKPYENQLVSVLEAYCASESIETTKASPTSKSFKPEPIAARATPTDKGERTVVLNELRADMPLYERPAEALRLATEAFAQTGYWIAFYKAILGPDGVVARLFPTEKELDYFHATPEFLEIMKSITAIRTSDFDKVTAVEPQKMLTIRIPATMKESLSDEAERFNTSINKLAISKLLLPIDREYVPIEVQQVKGFRPGSKKKTLPKN